jgi:hypothetical protein
VGRSRIFFIAILSSLRRCSIFFRGAPVPLALALYALAVPS